jgi:hypothetical protein
MPTRGRMKRVLFGDLFVPMGMGAPHLARLSRDVGYHFAPPASFPPHWQRTLRFALPTSRERRARYGAPIGPWRGEIQKNNAHDICFFSVAHRRCRPAGYEPGHFLSSAESATNPRVPHPSRILRRVGYLESRYRPSRIPPFAKNAKDPGFLPRSAGQDRVCAFL